MSQRGTNYSSEEDVAIAKAYVSVTTDAITGNEQPGTTYYSRIYDSYKLVRPKDAPLRPLASIETRVKDIQKQCTRFSGCVRSIKAMKRSGISAEDELRLATALFNKKEVQHPREDVGKAFKYMDAWHILCDLPKFSAATAGLSAESQEKRGVKRERPEGRQKAKQERDNQEHRDKKMRMAAKAVELQKKQVHELEMHNMILLFTNGPGGADSAASREFFTLQQKEALRMMRARASADRNSTTSDGEDALGTLAEVACEEAE